MDWQNRVCKNNWVANSVNKIFISPMHFVMTSVVIKVLSAIYCAVNFSFLSLDVCACHVSCAVETARGPRGISLTFASNTFYEGKLTIRPRWRFNAKPQATFIAIIKTYVHTTNDGSGVALNLFYCLAAFFSRGFTAKR